MARQYFVMIEYTDEGPKIGRIEADETKEAFASHYKGLQKFLFNAGQRKTYNPRRMRVFTLASARERLPEITKKYEEGCSWYMLNLATGETTEPTRGLKPLEAEG